MCQSTIFFFFKAIGVRMGLGKGSIHHYVTPVKAGRIIIEVGGNCEYEEVSFCFSHSRCNFVLNFFKNAIKLCLNILQLRL